MSSQINQIKMILQLKDEGILDNDECLSKIGLIANKDLEIEKERIMEEVTMKNGSMVKIPATKLKRRSNKGKYKTWSEEEIQFLKENYGLMTLAELADRLGRGKPAIYVKMWELRNHKSRNVHTPKVNKYTPSKKNSRWTWTEEEDNYLKENRQNFTMKELAEELGRTFNSVEMRIRKLGIKKKNGKGVPIIHNHKKLIPFSIDDDNFILANMNRLSQSAIAKQLGRRQSSVWGRIKRLQEK